MEESRLTSIWPGGVVEVAADESDRKGRVSNESRGVRAREGYSCECACMGVQSAS